MAYQIEYDHEQIITIKHNPKKEYLHVFLLVLMLVTGSILAHFGGSILQKIILGDKQHTQAVTEQLVTNIQSGIPIRNAVQAFCAELMQ